jgi:hypothetical protein
VSINENSWLHFLKKEHIEKAISQYDMEYPNNDWKPNPNGKFWYDWKNKYYWVIYRQNETADRGRPLKKIFIMAVNNAKPGYFDSRNDFNTHDAEIYCEDLGFQVGHRPEYG